MFEFFVLSIEVKSLIGYLTLVVTLAVAVTITLVAVGSCDWTCGCRFCSCLKICVVLGGPTSAVRNVASTFGATAV